jgi:hypothetical protein
MSEICERHHTPARNNPQKHTLRYYEIACPYCRIEMRDAELAECQRERDNWIESAREFCKNMEYYRGQCDLVLKPLGVWAYTSDDGTIQDEPLRAKMAKVVEHICQKTAEEIINIVVEKTVLLSCSKDGHGIIAAIRERYGK